MNVLQSLVDSLTLGSLYAIIALGIALIFGVMQLFNFAHGELIMLSALMMVILNDQPLPVVIVASIATPIAAALLMDRAVFRHIRSSDPMTLLVASFGVSILIQSVVETARGNVTPAGAQLTPWLAERLEVGAVATSHAAVLTIAVVIVLLAGTALMLRSTQIGMQMRAAAEDFEMARLLGVRANSVLSSAFAVSGFLAGAAALLLVGQTGAWSLQMGTDPVLFGFIASVVGGIGSLAGAVLGGYAVAILSTALQVWLPDEVAPFRSAILFGLLFVFVSVRPNGLVPGSSTRMRAG